MIKVQRDEWGARPPRNTPSGINTISATDHWEGTTLGIFAHESCATKVRGIQAFHMDSRGWNDIAYNFVVCPHGFVYVGRDHGIRSAANGTNPGNNESEAVCYLGGPTDQFTEAGKIGVKEIDGEISDTVYPHQHWFNTQCPGNEIVDWLNNGMVTSGVTAPSSPSSTPSSSWPNFPLPSGHWFGTPSADSRNHSGYYDSRDRLYVALIQNVARDKASQNIKSDGFFGPGTKEAVLNIQKFFHLQVDGKVGSQTWGLLGYLDGLK